MAWVPEWLTALTRPKHDWFGTELITTERLRIGPVTEETLSGFSRLFDSDFARAHRFPPHEMLRLHRLLDPDHGPPHTLLRKAVTLSRLADPADVVGYVELSRHVAVGALADRLFIGTQIAPPHRNQGYLSEALAAVVDYMTKRRIDDVWIGTDVANEPVIRSCRRLGFREHGLVRHTFPDASEGDMMVFEVLPPRGMRH